MLNMYEYKEYQRKNLTIKEYGQRGGKGGNREKQNKNGRKNK